MSRAIQRESPQAVLLSRALGIKLHSSTIVESLVLDSEQKRGIFSGVATFADGLSFRFIYGPSDGHVSLRRNTPDPRWWPRKTVLTRVSSPRREAACSSRRLPTCSAEQITDP